MVCGQCIVDKFEKNKRNVLKCSCDSSSPRCGKLIVTEDVHLKNICDPSLRPYYPNLTVLCPKWKCACSVCSLTACTNWTCLFMTHYEFDWQIYCDDVHKPSSSNGDYVQANLVFSSLQFSPLLSHKLHYSRCSIRFSQLDHRLSISLLSSLKLLNSQTKVKEAHPCADSGFLIWTLYCYNITCKLRSCV